MRRKKCGGYFFGIVPALLVLSILGTILGTKNASAFEYTQELTSTGRALPAAGDWVLRFTDTAGTTRNISQTNGYPRWQMDAYSESTVRPQYIQSVCSATNVNGLVQGNYYKATIAYKMAFGGNLAGMMWQLGVSEPNWPIMSIKETDTENMQLFFGDQTTQAFPQGIRIWEIIIQYTGEAESAKMCFGSSTGTTNSTSLFAIPNMNGSYPNVLWGTVLEFSPQNPAQTLVDKDNEDRQNIEQQQQDNQDAADDNQNDVDTTTASMADVAGSIVGAVAQIHQTNCRLPNMTINGMELKDMDLCTFDTPPGLQALASVGMIFLMIPLSIRLIKRLLNLYREILG